MTRYAERTKVSPDKTLTEIRQTLARYKATGFGFIEADGRVGIAFEMQNRRVRFVIPLPSLTDEDIIFAGGGATKRVRRSPGAQRARLDQVTAQRWRALLLVIKAKLESVESGVETFEEAFMAQILLPDGRTMGEWAAPQIEASYGSNQMPPLLTA